MVTYGLLAGLSKELLVLLAQLSVFEADGAILMSRRI
jgi:hypothetical protein